MQDNMGWNATQSMGTNRRPKYHAENKKNSKYYCPYRKERIWGIFLPMQITEIRARISNYSHNYVWDVIIDHFLTSTTI